jgi:hypothetical protein
MRLESVFAAAMLAATSGAALAHHSFAMFAQESPIEIAGTVVEFKYTSPHSFILVDVKGKDGTSAVEPGRPFAEHPRPGWHERQDPQSPVTSWY